MENEYYEFYQYLRNMPPIMMDGSWLISKYADVKYILQNPELFSSERIDAIFVGLEDTPKINFVNNALNKWILHDDKTEHTKPIKDDLTMKLYTYFNESLDHKMQSKLNTYCNNLDTQEFFNFRKEIAIPIVCQILMDVLEVEKVDEKRQEKLIFFHMQRIAVFIAQLTLTNEEAEAFGESLLYITLLGPNFNGMTSQFDETEYLKSYSIIDHQKGNVYHAFVHDTVNLICNVFYLLNIHKDKLNETNLSAAIDECIRLEPPVQTMVRTSLIDFELRGQKIHKGDAMSLFIGSANRDEEMEALHDPDDFIIGRKRIGLFNFGFGIHACLGQRFAKQMVTHVVQKFIIDKKYRVSNIEWDNSVRTYRNMRHLIIQPN